MLGLWGSDLDFRLPDHLPALPQRPAALPFIEADAVAHRIDLQMARMELDALAKALYLTEASRFVTMLDMAGIDRKTREPGAQPSSMAARQVATRQQRQMRAPAR